MTRVLVLSDAASHTGFANVTHSIFDQLADRYDIHVLAANYRGDYWPTPLKLYLPTQKLQTDVYGQSRFIELLGALAPDAVVMVNDPSVIVGMLLQNPWDTDRVFWRGISNGSVSYKPPILAYMPIDGYNTPGSWDILKDRVTRIAMSRFGQEAMPEAPLIWHGVDTTVFHPRDKAEAKRALGYDPDRFLIVRVDKNSIRKDFPATWAALRPVLRKYSDIDVHFHCQEVTPENNLTAYRWNDEDIRDRVRFPNIGGFTGWDTESLATLYAAADLFVSTSHGEGFGLPLLESIASGTPVIATDCSAITEVVGPGGILIPPAGRIAAPMGQEQVFPDIPAFSREIERLYLAGGVRRKLAKAGVAHAQNFSWNVAAERFAAFIDQAIAQPIAA